MLDKSFISFHMDWILIKLSLGLLGFKNQGKKHTKIDKKVIIQHVS